jgi:hypothetical protein
MAWERSGVPGGSTRTSWFGRDVPAMWRLLENQQSNDHWRLVAGWRKASELTAAHLRRLEHYRTNLADVWPPDRNAAAAAYVARLDFLIQNVRTTHEVAAANYSTLAATVGALAAARQDLKPLHDEYVAKSRAIKDHANLTALNAAAEAPTVIGAAPAGPQDLERLNNRARAIMYSLSHTLIEAEAAIRQPPTYQAGTFRDPGDPDVYGKARPATREPDRSIPMGSTKAINAMNQPASSQWGVGGSTALPGQTPPAVQAGQIGIIAPAPVPTPERTLNPNPFGNGGRSVTPDLTEKPRARPLAPGGVIGGTPASGTTSSREQTRVNPVGGVIANHRLPGQQLAGHPAFASLARQSSDERRRRIEQGVPDTLWELEEGVPEVIQPPKEPPFDTGPVIGLSR